MGYQDTIGYLYGLQKHGIKLGLDTTFRLLGEFGNPHRSFRSAHIAGTNGKGSTSAMLAAMLSRAGKRTGLFTSPHLVSFTERITVDGEPIAEGDVVALAEDIRQKTAGMNPTFFEVVTVMGFLYFRQREAEWAVVETGMGGRLDATNVLSPEVSVITPLSMDHREFLGDTPEAVAREKAGIVKPGVPLVSAAHKKSQMEVVARAAREAGSPLYVYGRDFSAVLKSHAPGRVVFDYVSDSLSVPDISLPLSGAYQAMNAALAIKALETLGVGGDIEATVREALASITWPGRLQVISEDPTVMVDGAHNPVAAQALAETLKSDFLKGGKELVLVMGIMADKDIRGILRPLLPLASEVIFAAPAYGRSAPAHALRETARGLGFEAREANSVREALGTVKESRKDALILVTGSFFTIGEAMEAEGKRGFLTRLREWQPPR